jgi:hypothetical protein
LTSGNNLQDFSCIHEIPLILSGKTSPAWDAERVRISAGVCHLLAESAGKLLTAQPGDDPLKVRELAALLIKGPELLARSYLPSREPAMAAT